LRAQTSIFLCFWQQQPCRLSRSLTDAGSVRVAVLSREEIHT
jgi:hypothetical protein